MHQEELFQELIEKYITHSITPSETKQLSRFLEDPIFQKKLELIMDDEFADKEYFEEESDETRQRIFEKIEAKRIGFSGKVIAFSGWKKVAMAASVIFLIGFVSWFFIEIQQQNEYLTIAKKQTDVNPGAFKAKLTLADGTTIVLDSAVLGELIQQGNSTVIHKDGQLVYNEDGTTGEMLYNTVSTSRGETYSLTLADGSTVYLNSASSIKFPVAFSGTERRIEITGEAYFDVAKNVHQPFIVSVNGMDVQALGTAFNINAYPDESFTKTTLIEGSVIVSKDGNPQPEIIKPGQQTILNGTTLSVLSDLNIEEVIAWKEGFFHFESADLKSILRQFSRWYDVDVVYEGDVTEERFFVIMSRKSTLSSVLKALQANDIKFRIEGKRLIVQPR